MDQILFATANLARQLFLPLHVQMTLGTIQWTESGPKGVKGVSPLSNLFSLEETKTAARV